MTDRAEADRQYHAIAVWQAVTGKALPVTPEDAAAIVRVAFAMLPAIEEGEQRGRDEERETDAYGRCVPPCGCRDCGRPRRLAQALIHVIGASGPETAEETVDRAVDFLVGVPEQSDACPECEGRTVEFRGQGKMTQTKLCPRWREPGHLSEAECKAKIGMVVDAVMPSGRQG